MNPYKLSILVCSALERNETFIPKSLRRLRYLKSQLSKVDKKKVQILYIIDDKEMMLGDKRNYAREGAMGDYITYVDDDDELHDDYIKDLLEAIEKYDVDVITFNALVTINGGQEKICRYSSEYLEDHNTDTEYHRLPNHIACVRKSVSMNVSFPSIIYGEDALYSKLLRPFITSEHYIDKALYYYNFNEMSTIAQEKSPSVIRRRQSEVITPDAIADVVILSNAKTPQLRALTEEAIESCKRGANGLKVNIYVVEQEPHVSYRMAKTIFHMADFHYNSFCNLAASQGQAKWIVFSNNDVVFQDSWLHHLLAADHPLVSPKCPKDSRQTEINKNTTGNQCGKHFSGWCFMMKRELWEQMGRLPEVVSFWFSDNATIKEANKLGIKPMIVPASNVLHLGSTTFKTVPKSKWNDMTWRQCYTYNSVYNDNLFEDNLDYQRWKAQNGLV